MTLLCTMIGYSRKSRHLTSPKASVCAEIWKTCRHKSCSKKGNGEEVFARGKTVVGDSITFIIWAESTFITTVPQHSLVKQLRITSASSLLRPPHPQQVIPQLDLPLSLIESVGLWAEGKGVAAKMREKGVLCPSYSFI